MSTFDVRRIFSFAPQREHRAIEKIIEEERQHYLRLSDMAKQIGQ